MCDTLRNGRDDIGAAIGRIPSGCSILTASHDGRSTGVLVSWVQQAAFDPPSITVALRRGRPVLPLIEQSGRFLLNVIGDEPAALFRHFGRGFGLDDDAFAGIATLDSAFGPRLSDCIAHLGCEVTQRVGVGDHDLFIAAVVAGAAEKQARPYVHIRNSGLGY